MRGADLDLVAAAPVLGKGRGRGLKCNCEADVRGGPGGRARTHVWDGLRAGSEPGGALERLQLQRAQQDEREAGCTHLLWVVLGAPQGEEQPVPEPLDLRLGNRKFSPFAKMWRALLRKA